MGNAPAASAPLFRNEILRILPGDEIASLRASLARVRLVNGQILHAPGKRIEHVYFVEQGFISMVADADDRGGQVEVGLIGRESMVGLTVVLGMPMRSYNRAMVQLPGIAYSLPVTALASTPERTPVLNRILRQQLGIFMAQMAQTAACNGRHTLSERLARWLLMARDRVDVDELALTQEFLAIMLAVRRSGVTLAIQSLATAGLVRHSRGRIVVCDRPGLESAACSCYSRVRRFAETFTA